MEEGSLFEESGRNYNSDDDDRGINRDDEAEEVSVPTEAKSEAIKPKRIIRNPQPKLDAQRLMGPRGIGILQSTFKNTKFKGKGHETEDLNVLMKKLEHWAHRLYPKLPFSDTLTQIEKLGTKKPVQIMMKRVRLDMFQSDEITVEDDTVQVNDENVDPEPDVFDQLLDHYSTPLGNATGFGSSQTTTILPSRNPSQQIMQSQIVLPGFSSSVPVVNTNQPKLDAVLTPEQKDRMRKNQLLAAERRLAKHAKEREKQKEMEVTDADLLALDLDDVEVVSNTQNSLKISLEEEISVKSNPSPLKDFHVESSKTDRLRDSVLADSVLDPKGLNDSAVRTSNYESYSEAPSEVTQSAIEKVSNEMETEEVNASDLCTEDEILAMLE